MSIVPSIARAITSSPHLCGAIRRRRPQAWPPQRAPRIFSPFSTALITFTDEYGDVIPVQADIGETLLEAAHKNNVDLEGACGGELACSTCHVILTEEWYDKVAELSAVSEEEEDMLDLAMGLTDTSRLGCQICVTKELDGLEVAIPEED